VVTRGGSMLTAQDPEIAQRFTALAEKRWDVHLSARVRALRADGAGIEMDLDDGDVVRGDLLLVAAGRRPNSDRLDLAAGGIATHPDGRIDVDAYGRTSAEGVWAIGDVSSPYQLKHVANAEARTVAHNLVHGDDLQELDHRFVPAAVFTDPQIASVGATSRQLDAAGRPYVVATQAYGATAFGWAMEDREGVCRLYADPATGLLLGAHIMGYQASSLIQPLVQAMSFAQPARQVARGQYWIHPALSEVVENALLQLPLP
jgi:mycothione reductase